MATRGVNKVILIGNLGLDPETRYMPSGAAVTNVRLATSETWKDKNTGEQQERTEWHRVVFFNRLAEIAGEYMKKGSRVYVEGKLVTRKWQDKEGRDQYTTEIHAAEMQILSQREQGSSSDGYDYNQSYDDYSRQQPAQQASQPAQRQAAAPVQQSARLDDFDDDIPF